MRSTKNPPTSYETAKKRRHSKSSFNAFARTPVSLKDVLYSSNPTYYKTYAQYKAETLKHIVFL